MSNSLWQIAFGPYALIVDRRTLRFDLRDTKAGIVWAESLPLGWIELENRETGETSRHEFGDCKIISVSEKAGAQGKRILFGLDAPGGVPIDVYVICTEREIQLTVEASRDGKTHRVTGFGLVPGLVSVPDDGASYLVLTSGAGFGALARDVPDREMLAKRGVTASVLRYPIWQESGVTMPFCGAVRAKAEAKSITDAPAGSLGLITDSAYGAFVLTRHSDGSATLDVEYERDPERRRLDVRLVVLPEENHVGIARAYRDKVIGEKNHITLRRKIRERPVVNKLIGAAWYSDGSINDYLPAAPMPDEQTLWGEGYAPRVQATVLFSSNNLAPAFFPSIKEAVFAPWLFDAPLNQSPNRWETMEAELERITEAQKKEDGVVGVARVGDWAAIAVDFWQAPPLSRSGRFSLPLFAVVYHDSLIVLQNVFNFYRGSRTPAGMGRATAHDPFFLFALLGLESGIYYTAPRNASTLSRPVEAEIEKGVRHRRVRMHAVLSPLHRLTFTAFLTAHRFLTPDTKVEEAIYSDKTRIIVNHDDWNTTYETPELHLPPGGFWVRHAQMEAHDALRVGEQTFTTRAFRIRRALDGKPLEQSSDIETLEFKV